MGPWGTTGALGVCWIKKLHKTKTYQRLISEVVPFMKNVEIPKFWSSRWPAPPSGPVFPGFGPKIKILLPTFLWSCLPISEKVWHNPLPWEAIDLVEKSFFRVRAWRWGPRDPNHPPKNYLQGVKWTLKIWPISGPLRENDSFTI